MKYHGMCLTCKHWTGDKEGMRGEISRDSGCMDKEYGYPELGGCVIWYEWADFDVNGFARVSLSVGANFGCNRWEAEE